MGLLISSNTASCETLVRNRIGKYGTLPQASESRETSCPVIGTFPFLIYGKSSLHTTGAAFGNPIMILAFESLKMTIDTLPLFLVSNCSLASNAIVIPRHRIERQ